MDINDVSLQKRVAKKCPFRKIFDKQSDVIVMTLF